MQAGINRDSVQAQEVKFDDHSEPMEFVYDPMMTESSSSSYPERDSARMNIYTQEMNDTNQTSPETVMEEIIIDQLERKKFIGYENEEWEAFFTACKNCVHQIVKKCSRQEQQILEL